MARTSSNATQLSAALTRAEIAETLLEDARKQLADAQRQIEGLNEKLALARDLFVEQRTTIRDLRASRAVRGSYNAGAAQRSAEFQARRAQRAALSAQYFAAHPDARSASDADIQQWAQQAQ